MPFTFQEMSFIAREHIARAAIHASTERNFLASAASATLHGRPFMAEETNTPARSEGAGQKKDRPQPVNLAVVEAAERGMDFTRPVAPPPRASAPPKAAPEPVEEVIPEA